MTIEVDTLKIADDVMEKMRHGEEVTIADHGRVIAKLVPLDSSAPSRERIFGQLKGKIEVPDDFLEPMSEEELAEWGK